MNARSFSEMQHIARSYDIDLITRQILIKKKCQINKEEVETKIPKEIIKHKYGINIEPIFTQGEGFLTITIQNVGDLYDLSPDEFESICEILSTIDLNSPSFTAADSFDSEVFDDGDELFQEFESLHASNSDEEGDEDTESNEEVEEVKPKKEGKIQFSEEKVLAFIRDEVKKSFVCTIEEVQENFGDAVAPFIIPILEKSSEFIFDKKDKTIVEKE